MLKAKISEFLDFATCRFSLTTTKLYKHSLILFSRGLHENISIAEIRPLDIEKFIIRLKKSGLTSKSCNTYLVPIKSFFHWCQINYNAKNPSKQIKKLRENPSCIRIPNNKEYKLILQTAHRQEKHIIQFLANTGLRKSEFFSITENSFVQNFSYVRIEHGKGNKFRLVPLNETCKKLIDFYYKLHGGFVPFTSVYDPRIIYYRFQDIAYRAKIQPFTPHSFRHFFATRLIKRGVPLVIVSRILGHANTLITEKVYCHLCPGDLRVTECLEI